MLLRQTVKIKKLSLLAAIRKCWHFVLSKTVKHEKFFYSVLERDSLHSVKKAKASIWSCYEKVAAKFLENVMKSMMNVSTKLHQIYSVGIFIQLFISEYFWIAALSLNTKNHFLLLQKYTISRGFHIIMILKMSIMAFFSKVAGC